MVRCVVTVCCVVTVHFIDPSGMCCPTRTECSNDVLLGHRDMYMTRLVCVVQRERSVVMVGMGSWSQYNHCDCTVTVQSQYNHSTEGSRRSKIEMLVLCCSFLGSFVLLY